ncbi:MAG TPA: aldo/keto reductase [Streptosporangiaceae bacterium]|nr:aldo/keto reductase [Streptosporangiaceae bacterium]
MTKAPEIPSVTLPGGADMPLLGFGTWQLRGSPGYECVLNALELGYRHIDTATMYGNEAEVGHALRDSRLDRSEIFVTTKLPPGKVGRERKTLTASLRALGTDYVDLWLVHWPPAPRTIIHVWCEFLALREEGLARTVGVSNYSPAQIDALIRATDQAPAVNQIPWSPALYDPHLLADNRERGATVEGYSPLKGTDLGDPVLVQIASEHGVSPAQVVLRWHIEHGIPVIAKSARVPRIAANIDLLSFTLSPDEMARIDALSRR